MTLAVANCRATDRKRQANVSEIVADVGETHATAKPRVGKTGVELRFHTRSVPCLMNRQRKELSDYHNSCEDKGQSRKLPKKAGPSKSKHHANRSKQPTKMKTMIDAAVASAVQFPATRLEGTRELSQPDHQIEMHPNLVNTSALIVASLAQGKSDDDDDIDMEFFASQTDLDSHANMCVTGKYAFVLADSGTHRSNCSSIFP
jgi:hypothetical protein